MKPTSTKEQRDGFASRIVNEERMSKALGGVALYGEVWHAAILADAEAYAALLEAPEAQEIAGCVEHVEQMVTADMPSVHQVVYGLRDAALAGIEARKEGFAWMNVANERAAENRMLRAQAEAERALLDDCIGMLKYMNDAYAQELTDRYNALKSK